MTDLMLKYIIALKCGVISGGRGIKYTQQNNNNNNKKSTTLLTNIFTRIKADDTRKMAGKQP